MQSILLSTLVNANTWLPAVPELVCKSTINHLDDLRRHQQEALILKLWLGRNIESFKTNIVVHGSV